MEEERESRCTKEKKRNKGSYTRHSGVAALTPVIDHWAWACEGVGGLPGASSVTRPIEECCKLKSAGK